MTSSLEGDRLFKQLKSISLAASAVGGIDRRDFEMASGELDVDKLRDRLDAVKSKRVARARKFGEIATPLGEDSSDEPDDAPQRGRVPVSRHKRRGVSPVIHVPVRRNNKASASRWGKSRSRSPLPPPKRRPQQQQQEFRRRRQLPRNGDGFVDRRRPKSRYDDDDDDDGNGERRRMRSRSPPTRRSRQSDDDLRQKNLSKRRNRSRSDFVSEDQSRSRSPPKKKKSKKKSKMKNSKRKRKSRNSDSESESEVESDFSDSSDSDRSVSRSKRSHKSSKSKKQRSLKQRRRDTTLSRSRSPVRSNRKTNKKRKLMNGDDNSRRRDGESDYDPRSVSRERSPPPPAKKNNVKKKEKKTRNWFDDDDGSENESDDIRIIPKKKSSKNSRKIERDDGDESKEQNGSLSDSNSQKIQSVIAGGDGDGSSSSDEDSDDGEAAGAVEENGAVEDLSSDVEPNSKRLSKKKAQRDASESKTPARSASRSRSLSPSGSSHKTTISKTHTSKSRSKSSKSVRRPRPASSLPQGTQVVRRGRGFQMTFKGSLGLEKSYKSPKKSPKKSKKRSRHSRRTSSSSRESSRSVDLGRDRNTRLKGSLGYDRDRVYDQEDRRMRSRMKSRHKRKREPSPEYSASDDDASDAKDAPSPPPPGWDTRTAASDGQFEAIMRYGSEELQYRLLALVNKKFRLNKSLDDLEDMTSSDRGEFYSDCEIYGFLLDDDFHKGRPDDAEPEPEQRRTKRRRRESHKKEDAWAAKMGANSGRVRNRVNQIAGVLDKTFCLNYLDVGTGSGDIGVGIAQYLNLDKAQVTLLDVDDHRSEASKNNAVFEKVAPDAKFEFSDDEQYSLITALMTLHHVKDDHLERRVREMYRVLQQQGVLIIREHDHDVEGLSLVIDIEHMLYDLQVMSWYEAVGKYFAHFRSAREWKRMFEHIGMTYKHNIPIHAGENPTRWYYAVFRKEKADLKRARERDEDGDVVDFGNTNFDDVIHVE